MSKQGFWDKQNVLHCPECGKEYKSRWAMMAHFSREHGATTLKAQLTLFEKALDNLNEKVSILTTAENQRLTSRGTNITCHKCGKQIRIGEWFIRKRRSGRIPVTGIKSLHMSYYHQNCWDGMFLETEQ